MGMGTGVECSLASTLASASAFCVSVVLAIHWKRGESSVQQEGEQEDSVPNPNGIVPLVRYLSDHGTRAWNSYNNDLELFVQAIPKIELHVHLDGSVDPDFLWSYISKNAHVIQCLPVSANLPWDPPNQLPVQRLVQQCQTAADFRALCTCRGHRSLKAMLNCFAIFLPLVRQNLDLIEQLAFDFVQRQWEQNAIYTEVRYSPHLLEEDFESHQQPSSSRLSAEAAVDAESVFQAVTRGLRRGCSKFHVVVNQIICAVSWRPDWALESLELVRKYKDAFPCAAVGIDIAAGEEHFDRELHPQLHGPHFSMIQRAKQEGIPITIHAGESTDQAMENVRRSVLEYGASRIGHGYRMVGSRDVMELVKHHRVHVEICPTSSFETGGWATESKDWRNHPCVKMKNTGISFSLNSDDPAVFHTSLAWQYRLALMKMEFTREDLVNCNLSAVEAAFCSEGEKQRLRAELVQFASQFHVRPSANFKLDGHSSMDSISSTPSKAWGRSVSDSFIDRVYVTSDLRT